MRPYLCALAATAAAVLGFAGAAQASVTLDSRSIGLDVHLTATDPAGTRTFDDSDADTSLDPYDNEIGFLLKSPSIGTENENDICVNIGIANLASSFFFDDVTGEAAFYFDGAAAANSILVGNGSSTADVSIEYELTFTLSETYHLGANPGANQAGGNALSSASVTLSGPGGVLFNYTPVPGQLGAGYDLILAPGTYSLTAAAAVVGVAGEEVVADIYFDGGFTPLPEPGASALLILLAPLAARSRRARLGGTIHSRP